MRIPLAILLLSTGSSWAAGPALTIYNQNFAVVREEIPLNLKKGTNRVSYADATAQVEADSVVLRDPSGKQSIQILEQSYRADPVSQELLLSLNEGKTIDFLVPSKEGTKQIPGKIVRSGYVPVRPYDSRRTGYVTNAQPIIEMEGLLRFGLPGTPLFPKLADDTILRPTLGWSIESASSANINAELAYVTGGFSWEATYNIVAPPKGDKLDVVGWVTVDNQSGKTFETAKLKLMAGDVNKVQPGQPYGMAMRSRMDMVAEAAPAVTEKAFDEYHLYSLPRATTLRDRETKQVEFIRADAVSSEQIYVYDGAESDRAQHAGWAMESIRQDPNYGTQSNRKVWVMRRFSNAKTNHLGMPLPKGRVRFYRRDDDGQLEFTGENTIDHTPKDEMVQIYTGNAFDLLGERRRVDYKIDHNARWVDESFEIKLRNRKETDAEIRVVETLYRWSNWKITAKSHPFQKLEAQKIEFGVTVPANQEKVVTYSVHYTW